MRDIAGHLFPVVDCRGVITIIMDLVTQLAEGLGIGCAVGCCIATAMTLVFIPISFMMNRYIYHGVGMRIAIGIFSGIFCVPIFVVLLIMRWWWPRIHYFGLMPLQAVGEAKGVEVEGWILPFIMSIFKLFRAPLTLHFETDGENNDMSAYKSAIEVGMHLLPENRKTLVVPGVGPAGANIMICPGAVCEEFNKHAVAVGTISKEIAWKAAITQLEGAGAVVFGNGPVGVVDNQA